MFNTFKTVFQDILAAIVALFGAMFFANMFTEMGVDRVSSFLFFMLVAIFAYGAFIDWNHGSSNPK
jgi:uncharacterized membrane protein YjjP (DUF1212 family)